MKVHPLQASGLHQCPEMVVHILREQVLAFGVGEHQPVGIVPLRARSELHLKLVPILSHE